MANIKYPFKNLEVGESFIIHVNSFSPKNIRKSVFACKRYWASKLNSKFTIETLKMKFKITRIK